MANESDGAVDDMHKVISLDAEGSMMIRSCIPMGERRVFDQPEDISANCHRHCTRILLCVILGIDSEVGHVEQERIREQRQTHIVFCG